MPPDAWFVALHVRESGFWKSLDTKFPNNRSADIATYLPAIREITRRGGWVIRVGDAEMGALPPMEHVIDYAHSPAKSDWMDVFLYGGCRFFIGGPSD